MDRILLTYDTMHHAVMAYELPQELVDIPWFAVARGALPFATMLSVKYNKRFGVIDPKDGFITPLHKVIGESGPILIIDDVVGTGSTIQRVKDLLEGVEFQGKAKLLLLVKTPGDKSDAHVLEGANTYYDFPWEPNGE